MDKPVERRRVVPLQRITVKLLPVPPGHRHKLKPMAQVEAEARRRRWLLIGAAVIAALALGVLVGRFLLS